MAYNGSGTFNITTAGEPVVTGTVISSTAFNALTADLATGLSTAITKDGQTTTTVRVPFAQGISSTLVTDATSTTTGSIITAGGISCQKAAVVGTLLGVGMAPSNVLDITQNQNSGSTGNILNNNAGASAFSQWSVSNGTNSSLLRHYGTAYTTSGINRQDGAILLTTGAGGFTLGSYSVQPIYFDVNHAEVGRFDTSGNLCVGTTAATGRLNIGGGSIYNSTSGVYNTAGPVSITIPGDTDGFIVLNGVQSGVGKVSYLIHYMNVSGTVTINTVSTLVTGTSPITAITPGTNVITLTLFAANTNVNWGIYNGPRG